MLSRSDACPDAARDLALRQEANSKLIDSIRYLLGVCRDAGVDTARSDEVVDGMASEKKLSGMLHVVHDRLADAARTGDEQQVSQVLEALPKLNYEEGPARVAAWYRDGYDESLHELYFDACDAGFRRTYKAHFDGRMPSEDEYAAAKSAARLALDRMERIDKLMFDELNVLVSDVMIFHSDVMNAATSVSSLGIIRMSQLRPGQTWTRYLENLAHEAAHHHLNYLFFTDPIILNEDVGLFASPLRQEKRPLSGIYHALFVLARSIRVLRALRHSPDYDPEADRVETAYNNAKNSASFEEKFNDCWAVLSENAKLTDLGRSLMASSRDMAFA